VDLSLSPALEAKRAAVRAFIDERVIPLEDDPGAYDEHENINLEHLSALRELVQRRGLWTPQIPVADGGLGCSVAEIAVLYEEMGRSIFGPVSFNCAAPDDGNMTVLSKVATAAQKERWLAPIVDGSVRSSFAMTEPDGGAGSDPSLMYTRAEKTATGWRIFGRKWFITGAGEAKHFILIARTSDDERKGLTAFLFHADQPGWRIVRRIGIMGPEEHGGHCELAFDGLEVADGDVLMNVGDGLKVTQIRLGQARLTHCMRWLGMARRALEIALPYVRERKSFGATLLEHESVQGVIGEAAMAIDIGRLLTMRAALLLDSGSFARKEISMAKIAVSEALGRSVDTAMQLCGARGYSRDMRLEWMYRYAPQARLVDGASAVHRMVVSREFAQLGADFWSWNG
jgi:acyl-CoA dehydrogenase